MTAQRQARSHMEAWVERETPLHDELSLIEDHPAVAAALQV